MVLNYEKLIMEYSEEMFELSKKYLSDFVSCFYADFDQLGKSAIIEKICDYTMMFEEKNNKKDSSIPYLYSAEPSINN